MPRNATATAILVLGMHRSGTSAIARMLNLRGAELGRDLLPPKQDNERGFWENRALLALHEQFLAQIGVHWHDLVSLPEDWRSGGAARWFVGALPDVLTQQFGDSALFLVKDPRLSLLAPLWIEVLESRAVRPVFVITVRDPDEVAASLAARDGFAPAKSHLLWLQHLLEAERATRGHPRIFVNYERVLADWRAELARISGALDISWPAQGADADRQIDEFIAPSLRHHRSDLRPSAAAVMPETVQQAYRVASAAGRDEASASIQAFDDLAAAFDSALNLGGPVIADLSGQLTRQREQHAQEVDRARATIDGFAAEIAQAREAHRSRDRIESELRDALAARTDEIERARNNIDALAAELGQAREGFAAKDREIDAARANIDALATDIARAAEVIATKDREIDQARS
ncbi:MAG TPA: sulfotransferase, partial [Rudaea sp.]|nr:sulfotransferase [Rudaea sp.]